MKRWMWALLVVAALAGLAGLRVWIGYRDAQAALAADVPPPVPLESIPPLKHQAEYEPGTTVEVWGEIVAPTTDAYFFVGLFNQPFSGSKLTDPDIQRGVAVKPGLFRMSVPRGLGPVYLYTIADKSKKDGPTDISGLTPYEGNPIVIRDRNVGGIKLTFP